ncbi:MAG: exosortase K [Saprospiraceae bacterium]|nr:exosortase K [Saprospiraceae bacterium]
MQTTKNIPYFLITFGLFILLKFGYTLADTNDLIFLLAPTNKLVGILTGSNSVYLSDSGYFHENLNIIIDKSCSGFNFWVLAFLLFTYLTVKYFESSRSKTLAIPASLIGAYLLTIFVNTSRIFTSIIVQPLTKNNFQYHQHTIHEAIGIITNLTFLVLAYMLLDKLLNQTQHHAKLT